jgi:hypothetical protein
MDAPTSLVTSWWLPISRAGEPFEPPPPAWPARSPPEPLPPRFEPTTFPSKFMYMPMGSEPFEEWLPRRFRPCRPGLPPCMPTLPGACGKKRAPRGSAPSPTEPWRSSSCHSPCAWYGGGAPAGKPASGGWKGAIITGFAGPCTPGTPPGFTDPGLDPNATVDAIRAAAPPAFFWPPRASPARAAPARNVERAPSFGLVSSSAPPLPCPSPEPSDFWRNSLLSHSGYR